MLEMAGENFVPEKAATKLNLIKYLFICLFNELLLLQLFIAEIRLFLRWLLINL